MATLGLIAKAVENLRSLQLNEQLVPDQDTKKKEKVSNCLVLTNGVSLATVKSAPQVLNLSIETLLCLCDDNDSDVRTVADECLNKIIRATADSYVLKIQFELYREIKRNGAARCLRAALWRFGLLSHMIRPVKAKVFAAQLTPCILEIVKRKEDVVVDTLSQSLPLILKTLGHYIPDKDVHSLLRAIFQNVTSNEVVVRRAAANMILTTCLNCRKPIQFLNFVMEQLIDMLSHVVERENDEEEGKEERLNTIFGVFACFRFILPSIDSNSEFIQDFNEDHILDHYICIYELCLFYVKFYSNHNVINAALETLSQLLQNPPKNVVAVLLSEDGITHRLNKLKERGRQWPSRISLSTTVVSEDNLESSASFLESDILDMPEIAPKVEKWMTDSAGAQPVIHRAQTKVEMADSSQIIDTKDLEDYSGLVIGSVENEEMEIESNASSDVGKFEKSIDTSLPACPDPKEEEYLDETTASVLSTHDVSMDQFMLHRSDIVIGSLTDNDPSMKYCCRLLISSFLLTGVKGQLMSDKLFRVSVKSLTLTCIGNILKLYPDMFFESLAKEQKKGEKVEDMQMISEVLLFADHSDPQIRGNLSMLVGYFLQGILAKNEGYFKKESSVTLDNLIKLILKGLEDESATTCRQTLTALGIFLPSLLESEENVQAIPILRVLPSIAKNPYFLIKIKLAEILSELPYTAIEYVSSELKFQENVVILLLKLLSDQDQRVRKAAGNAITKMMPSLYFECPHEDAVTRKASLYTELFLSSIITSPTNPGAASYIEHKLLINSLVKPYDSLFKIQNRSSRDRIDEALSRILGLLSDKLLVFSSKYLAYGCCETLSLLSETYLTTVYSKAWDCLVPAGRQKKTVKKSSGRGDAVDNYHGFSSEALSPLSNSLFSQSIVMLTSSPLSLDLSMHRHLLVLAGNLASGIACCNARPREKEASSKNETTEPINDSKYWCFFKDKQTSKYMEQLLIHVMRVLNIFQHVVEDLPSPIQAASKSALPSLPSAQSLSPKRKLLPDSSSKSKSSSSSSSSEKSSDHRIIFRFGGKDQLGSITGHSHYLRLYEILKAAHSNYRVTLEQEASELYLGLLNATLQVLSQILEVASLNEGGRIAEEILHYLQSTVLMSSTMTVQCVRQLLKCLFSTNLIARWQEVYEAQCKQEKRESLQQEDFVKGEIEIERGFYEQCFQRPARLMVERIKGIGSNCRGGNEPDTSHRLVTSTHRKEDRSISSFMKMLRRSNSDQSSVASYIRLFEPLVIKSLIQYTISNSVPLQCQVLMLLSQLVQLHINYCLMDSDKIFIGFVMKQFEFIEEGHMFQTEMLLPRVFDFLVRLSYEKYHSKQIIGVPKIIQLCDGLMASGRPPLTHCIPALLPVVEEMFLGRIVPANVNEEKELETTREVLISMMLRLAEYPEIIDLLAKCLTESRLSNDGNGEEKWRRWSRQAMDTVFPILSSRKLRMESKYAHFALVKLFSAVSPTVFRPVDPLLKVLFTVPPLIETNLEIRSQSKTLLSNKEIVAFKRWIGTVNVILLSLISYAKEEAMLARLLDLTPTITDLQEILLIPDSSRSASGDPLNVSGTLEPFTMPPEKIFSRFIFRVIGSMSFVIAELLQTSNSKVLSDSNDVSDENFLIHQFAFLLQLCIHMFETGSHCKLANASMLLIQGQDISKDERLPLNSMNGIMKKIGISCPILTCQWTYLLTLLGYDDTSFWSRVIGEPSVLNQISEKSNSKSLLSINTEILRRASTILFCDYVCENVSSDSERLGWLLNEHIEFLINLADESPVRELLVVAVHRDPAVSGLFLRAVSQKCCSNGKLDTRPAFVKRLLQCLEGAHQSQSGQLILTLVPRLLRSKYLALSRMAAKIASRRVEVLLALGKEEANQQITKENFEELMDVLRKEDLAKKHGALVGLLNKLATSNYEIEALEIDHSKPFDPTEVKNIKLDRTWFLSQVRSRCCTPCVSYGCYEAAWLLSHLELKECLEIFSSKDFNVKLLHECVIVGARLTHQTRQQLEFEGLQQKDNRTESTLFTAVKQNIIHRVQAIMQELPTPHEVFHPVGEDLDTKKQSSYISGLTTLLCSKAFQQTLFSIIPSVTIYVSSLDKLLQTIESDDADSLTGFAILCLETANYLVSHRTLSPRELELTLKCAREILKDPTVNKALSASSRYSWVCSAAASLTEISKYFCGKDGEKELKDVDEECSGLKEALSDERMREYAIACLKMSELVVWLEKRGDGDLPEFFYEPLRSLIISVSRQPLVNSFLLTPPLLWKNGCPVVGDGPTKCHFTLYLSEPNYIPELDVLEEFIFRVSLLGWNSRQQFEEIWMVLLGVLNVSQLQNETDSDVTSTLSHTASLAVQAITNLLMQTLILPCPGNPNNGTPIQHPRDPQLSLHKKSTRRLFYVQDLLLWKYENSEISPTDKGTPALEHIFNRGNLEPRPANSNSHSYGQLSVSYLWSLCSLHEDKISSITIALKQRRDEALHAQSLDVNSCLQFLLELYSSWLNPSMKLPARLLHEVVKSLLFVSELFVERSQFQWMLESCLDLWKTHLPEDEILRRHLIVAVCKSSAVLTPLDSETLEKVKRLIDGSLKCGSLSMKIATLHGILYLLESAVLANCEETMVAVHPIAIEYIQRYIDVQDSSRVSTQSEEHQCVLWALVFFLLEHSEGSPPDVEAPAVLELILSLLSSQTISSSLHRMLLQGLERLVATKSIIGKVSEQVVKISIERVRQTNPTLSLPALQLFLTCMYTDAADRFNQPEIEQPLPDVEPEILVRSIERSSAIFDKVKKAYPAEVEVLCAVLSEILVDFFPPLEILTKVIGEFLSPQQPHPRLMSAVVFKVCERACNSTQLDLLQTWVVFSIQNFIQSLPLIMSTWCLSCFFISSSTNPWLRALFPHVQSRIGKYEYEDKKILCIAASDFYSQLTNGSQKETFIKTFEDAAKTPGTPFADILASL